ncbi:hypothetical protein [Peterkaempfera sp. SMS 1(5)a]|uniref:hypothetical protein n=1 Tax=Peterkaempfera podocarpi TaxID=3232308 RepID=UPI00366E85A5
MRRRSPAIPRSAGTLAALCTIGAALLTGCSSSGPTNAAPSPSSAATTATTSTAAPAPSTVPASGPPPTATGTPAAHCRELTVPPAVKAEVTSAYGRQNQPRLVHIRPRSGTFYYGSCGGTTYAAAVFEPTAGATYAEQVASQDDGAAMKYLSRPANGGWTLLASDGLPRDPRGCAAIRQIPAPLAALWGDCLARP